MRTTAEAHVLDSELTNVLETRLRKGVGRILRVLISYVCPETANYSV